MAQARIAPAGQHQRIGSLHCLGALVLLHHQPGRVAGGHLLAEAMPGLHQALAEAGRFEIELQRQDADGQPQWYALSASRAMASCTSGFTITSESKQM